MTRFKNNIISSLAVLITLLSLSGCSKDNSNPPTTYPIQGLWEGTFTEVSGFQDPPGSTFYFSFSIYPNGTFSYKSGTSASGLFVYASGTWTLNGATFSFAGKTINGVGTSQDNIAGTATFDATNGSLNNGTITSSTAGTTASWKMTRVK